MSPRCSRAMTSAIAALDPLLRTFTESLRSERNAG
jgi:hypothetical protein